MTDTLVTRRYTFKLYPTRAQASALAEQSRMMAQLWNAALQRREDVYRREKRTLSAYDICKEIKNLRAAMPEWAALNADTPAAVVFMLDEAFKAFFRRAKRGDGASSGYPRYKRVADGMSIPFREMGKGWRMCAAAEIAEKSAMGQFMARQIRVTENGKSHSERQVLSPHPVATPADCGETERCTAPRSSALAVATPADSTYNWRIYIKGVAGLVRARGEFPVQTESIRDCIIMRRDGTWWLSVVVKTKPRRSAGADALKISFDLIDQFARVERADGQCLAGSQEQIIGQNQHHASAPGADIDDLSADDRVDAAVVGGWSGADIDDLSRALHLCERADRVQSDRDVRFKKNSWRWRRETKRAGRLTTRATRIRKHALHRWTSELIGKAADLTIVAPAIREHTASPRGDKKTWGASVQSVSALNRNTLNQSPALAMQMLAYKAAEVGIRCDVVTDETPKIAVGRDLVTTGKLQRRAERQLKKALSL